ncbi:MAG: hypothetical protein ACPHW5_02980, partial [Candidatus Puniceispirillales bacterium]
MIALEKTNHRWRQCFGMVMIMITLISVMMPVKPSFAHASGQSFVMLLPTDIYTLGGVIVVGLTII